MRKSLKNIVICGLMLFWATWVKADYTYTYTGNNFSLVQSPFTSDDGITGYFTVASPLGPNFASSDIGPVGLNLVTSWSFSNGLQTFDQNNSYPEYALSNKFTVSTDASGNIKTAKIALMSPIASQPDAVVSKIQIFFSSGSGSDFSDTNNYCATITGGYCTQTMNMTNAAYAMNEVRGAWSGAGSNQENPEEENPEEENPQEEIPQVPSVTAIPTLTEWALLALVALLLATAWRSAKKISVRQP